MNTKCDRIKCMQCHNALTMQQFDWRLSADVWSAVSGVSWQSTCSESHTRSKDFPRTTPQPTSLLDLSRRSETWNETTTQLSTIQPNTNVSQASSDRRCEIGKNTLTSITIVSLSKITKATPQQEKASYLSVFLKKYSASSFCLRTVSITFSMLVLQANQAMQKTKCTALEQSHSSSIHFMRVTYLWARSSRICMRATYLWARSSRICMRNLPRPLRRTSFTSWTS